MKVSAMSDTTKKMSERPVESGEGEHGDDVVGHVDPHTDPEHSDSDSGTNYSHGRAIHSELCIESCHLTCMWKHAARVHTYKLSSTEYVEHASKH